MKTSMKLLAALSVTMILAACGGAKSSGNTSAVSSVRGADCSTNRLQGFDGTFKGVLSPVNFEGERQPLENMIETQTVTSCNSFDFDIHYSNPETGEETRSLQFSGQWDEAKEGFVLTGALVQGLLRVIHQGQFLVEFDTKFAGNPAHCNEMITVSNNDQQIIRSVHCFAGGLDGPSLGVRTILASRVP